MKDFIKHSEKWIKKMPIDIEMHDIRSHIFRITGDYTASAHSAMIYSGLLVSLMSSGDGKTAETAIEVISLAEVYALLAERELEIVSQAINKHGIETMTCKNQEGEKVKVFFDSRKILTKRAERMKKDLQEKEKKANVPAGKGKGDE